MTKKSILILGGYGNAGKAIAEHLLHETDEVRVTLAGRNLSRAQELADTLNQKYGSSRAKALQVDASSVESLETAFKDVDMVVVASSTTEHSKQVAETATRAKIDYFDLMPRKPRDLESLQGQIKEAGCCFITDGGAIPGLPGALVRYAAASYSGLTSANVYCILQVDWKDITLSKETLEEFISEFRNMEAKVFINGQWEESSWTAFRDFDFQEPFHTRGCIPMYLEELDQLPSDIQGLQEMAFYIAGMNWMTDYLVTPLCIGLLSLFGDRASSLASNIFRWSVDTFSKPPYGTALVLDAKGVDDNRPFHLRTTLLHQDGYQITAIPVVVSLLQILDKRPEPGLYFQAQLVDPMRFFDDLKRLGIQVEVQKEEDQKGQDQKGQDQKEEELNEQEEGK